MSREMITKVVVLLAACTGVDLAQASFALEAVTALPLQISLEQPLIYRS